MNNKKSVLFLVGFIVCVTYAYLYLIPEKVGVDQYYRLPENFLGCVVIYYDVANAPALQIEGNEVVYEVPEDGVIYTSSALDEWWVTKNHSGSHRVRADYLNSQGDVVKTLPENWLKTAHTGAHQRFLDDENSMQEQQYFVQYIENDENPEQPRVCAAS